MSRISLPTREEVLHLARVRSDICVSIYLPTSPLGLHKNECRIELGNLIKQAVKELQEDNVNKRRLWALQEQLETAAGSDDFCLHQANSLALLATPEMHRMYRLANRLVTQHEISDRFYLKPLLRALTFPHTAYILALSENQARVVELFPEADPEEIKVPNLPKSAASAVGRSSITASISGLSHEGGKKDPKHRLAEYCRKVDEAMRPLLRQCDSPLILVAAQPLSSIYPSVASTCLAPEIVHAGPDHLSTAELVQLGRPVLDAYHAGELERTKALFEEREGQKRVVTDLTDAARAATFGMIELALVDFDQLTTGFIDDQGILTLSDAPEAYGVIDEIVKRAMEGGARVLAVRREDMRGATGIAATLRYTP